uniref:Uncharacterized protein n=1 Tax=Arundo donax TaxID=35708 RepID=A0A0A8ZUT1_ARUDO
MVAHRDLRRLLAKELRPD